jgi:hypothetical protein
MGTAMNDPPMAGTGRAVRFLTLSTARELGILLCLSVMFPFLIHIIPVPQDSRLGVRLLPMFYAPLIAALVGRQGTAFAVALLAPWLNWALTSHPSPVGASMMSLQLLVFVAVMRVLLVRSGARWFLATAAYLACMAATALAAELVPSLIDGRDALAWVVASVFTGLPGLFILVAINWMVLKCYPPGGQGGGPRFA